MHIRTEENAVHFCGVSPYCMDKYGSIDFPIYSLRSDGSWSRQCEDDYWRSKPNVLVKPWCEFTLNELKDIIDNSVINYIRKAG